MYKLYMQVFCFFGVKQQSSFYDSTPEVSLVTVFCLEHTFLFGSPCHHRYPWSIIIREIPFVTEHGQYRINYNFPEANMELTSICTPKSPSAHLLLPGQFAYALGKLLGGPMVDSLGGTNSLLAILLFLDLFLDRNGFCHDPRRLASQPFLFLPIRS